MGWLYQLPEWLRLPMSSVVFDRAELEIYAGCPIIRSEYLAGLRGPGDRGGAAALGRRTLVVPS
jgi:hypothetical protein